MNCKSSNVNITVNNRSSFDVSNITVTVTAYDVF